MKQFYSNLASCIEKNTFAFHLSSWEHLMLLRHKSIMPPFPGQLNSRANNSPGTGKAVVTIDGNLMRVQVTFSGLVTQTSAGLPSGTTASHIHAPSSPYP